MGGFLSKIKATGNGASAAAVVSAQIAANPDPVEVEIDKIQFDPQRFLFRQRIVTSQVEKLTGMINSGIVLDAVDVFLIDGVMWLNHGHHRYQAHKAAGKTTIQAVIRQGTIMDALEFAWRANDRHGTQLTEEDNLIKVASILKHKPATSDTEIAGIIGSSVTFASDARKKLTTSGAVQKPTDEHGNEIRMATRKGKDGKVTTYQIKVGGIGAKAKPAQIKATTPINGAGFHSPDDGKITKTIRLTYKEWDDLRGLLAGSEIGRVVMGQIGE